MMGECEFEEVCENRFLTGCPRDGEEEIADCDERLFIHDYLNSPQHQDRFVDREGLVEAIAIDLRNRARFDYTLGEIAEFIRTHGKQEG